MNQEMRNRWNYAGLGKVVYGHPESYERAAAFFDEVGGTVEDWGCGCAAFKEYLKNCGYVGLDGSQNDYADRCDVDLREYTSKADCILLRDVLDHNEDWRKVLGNALSSFQKRMVIVLFHDFGPETKVLLRHTSPLFPGVPDLQFQRAEFVALLRPYLMGEECIPADKKSFHNETVFYLKKS